MRAPAPQGRRQLGARRVRPGSRIEPPAPPVTRWRHAPETPEARAGLALMPLLARAQVFNLTGARGVLTEEAGKKTKDERKPGG